MEASVLDQVRMAAAKRILFLPHAVRQMSRPSRMISPAEIESAINAGELVEDYPEDVRGHSCLLLGSGDGGRSTLSAHRSRITWPSSRPTSHILISGPPISRRGSDHAVHAL